MAPLSNSLNRFLFLSGGALLVLAVWTLAPVYQFYAHRGIMPMPPWGWLTLDGPVPVLQQAFDPRYEAAGNRALQQMADYRAETNLPSLSAAVAVGSELVWVGSVGFSDIASRTPVTPETLFRIGSTSKALTATALARLVDRGDIDLDRRLSSYLAKVANPAWADVTARQLASHSAGIPHYGENRDWIGLYRSVALNHHYDDVRDALSVFDNSPLLFNPGTGFHYSSLGTVLLGAAMSDASGYSYRELIIREVFEPANMVSTYADGDGDQRETELATFYFTDGQRFRPWRKVDLSHKLPGGGFISSPKDLVQLGKMYFDASYLSVETREHFWTPQRLADGSINEQNYALGWRWREWDVEGIGVVPNANHGGVSKGSQCWLLLYPDYAMSMAFCTNAKTEEFGTFGRFYESLFRSFVAK
jgi:CubicO group peptidase (beta-lactamase class C family)